MWNGVKRRQKRLECYNLLQFEGGDTCNRKLTDRVCNRKPPAQGTVEIWDSALPGFGLRIGYGGRRAFMVMTRIAGKQKRFAVGAYPDLSLSVRPGTL